MSPHAGFASSNRAAAWGTPWTFLPWIIHRITCYSYDRLMGDRSVYRERFCVLCFQELPSLHPLPQLVLMSGSHLSSSSPFLLSQAQSGHQGQSFIAIARDIYSIILPEQYALLYQFKWATSTNTHWSYVTGCKKKQTNTRWKRASSHTSLSFFSFFSLSFLELIKQTNKQSADTGDYFHERQINVSSHNTSPYQQLYILYSFVN